MPAELARSPRRHRASAPGWMVVHPTFAGLLGGAGLRRPADVLDLPGEVVSGHADRHVAEVRLPGSRETFYLKREHHVGWRERLRNALAGFGWVSRSEREARMFRHLAANGFPCPEWAAYGEDGRGRAFFLVRGLAGRADLRRLLGDNRLSPDNRRRLAERFGQLVAELHASGITTPDLTAKHVFVDTVSLAVTLIDWPSAEIRGVRARDRVDALAALHASLAEAGATRHDRLRFLWAYLRVARKAGGPRLRFGAFARRIETRAETVSFRRSIRDQRQPGVTSTGQRLVWLAGEAVCAVPDVAEDWPRPAVAAPIYSDAPPNGKTPEWIRLPDGRPALLTRYRSFAPLGRLVARLRGRPWRSPGATGGRLLFLLERYGIPAPRLLAFGQRLTGPWSADSFLLSEPPSGVPLGEWLTCPAVSPEDGAEVRDQVVRLCGRLHDAGLQSLPGAEPFLVESTGRVAVDPTAVRFVRRSRRT